MFTLIKRIVICLSWSNQELDPYLLTCLDELLPYSSRVELNLLPA